MSWLKPVTLEGPHARLEPLSRDHRAPLVEAVRDGELWKIWYTFVPAPENMSTEIERRLSLQASGTMLPFTVRDAEDRIAGMTTYMNVDAASRRVEIGSTWYAKRVQRTAVNTQCKLLLLTHAFEKLDCIAVEFRTHVFNHVSRRGIERLGARQDGILRHHHTSPNGLRDTVVYSILPADWPKVKAHLAYELNERPREPLPSAVLRPASR
jgi:RimJ/RimL family protein N-acetyltransferase